MKIKSRAYIQLGEEALQVVPRIFQLDTPVILHLLALVDGTIDSSSNFTPHIVCYTRQHKLHANY